MTCGALMSFQSRCSLKNGIKISSSGGHEEPATKTFGASAEPDSAAPDFGCERNASTMGSCLAAALICSTRSKRAVETGVTDDRDVRDADSTQQFLADLVLYEEMGETLQHVTVLTSVPAEEYLSRTEDAADAIDGYTTVFQDMQVVIPELVLDEERHHGTDGSQEATCIGNGVQRQVANDVGSGIVLAHLIARGREERQQDFVLGMILSQLFDQRTALFELSQRGSMEPHVLGVGVDLLLQDADGLPFSTPHFAHLFIKQARNDDAQLVDVND